MPNSVLDPESPEKADKQYAPLPDNEGYSGDASSPQADLAERENNGNSTAGDGYDSTSSGSSGDNKRGGLFNRGGDSSSKKSKADSPSVLGKKENSGGLAGGGLFNPDSGGASGLIGKGSQGLSNLKGQAGKLAKNKWIVGLAGGIGGLLIVIVILVILLGALKIPNLAEHITAYQFNRVTREYAKSVQRTTAEKIALEAADDTTYNRLKARYSNLRENTWGKMDNYRPGVVGKNLQVKDGMKFNYERSSILGRERLKDITIRDQTFPVKRVTGPSRFVPGLKGVLQFRNDLQLSNTIAPAIDETLQSRNIGRGVRSVVANSIRKEAGISLIAWAASGKAFGGLTADKADVKLARDSWDKVGAKATDNPSLTVKETQQASDDVKEATKTTLASDEETLAVTKNGGVFPRVTDVLNKAFAPSIMDTLSGILNPVGAVGLPICIIYDGSLEKATSTIDNQTQSEQRSYYYLASASSQQKRGMTTPEAVGAYNRKVGDNISTSNPEIRANGGTVNTGNTLSAEASATGQVTVLDALLPGPAATAINAVADIACPVILSKEFLVASTAAQIVALILSGGTSEAAISSGEVGARSFIVAFQEGLSARFASAQAAWQAGKIESLGRVGSVVWDQGKTIGKTTVAIAGATVASKLIVMAHSNSLHNGTEQNDDFINEADAGGNFSAQQIDQKQNYGRPLNTPETIKSDKATRDSIAQINSAKSPFERYADVNNPDSLIDKMAIMSSAYIKPSFMASLVNITGSVLKPVQGVASLFGSIGLRPALAEVDSSNYGNIQFGWTDDEEALIDSNDSYGQLENQYILENYGDLDAIEAKFSPCYTRTIGVLLSGSESDDGPDIVRDQDSNVIDEGLCKKSNLSYNSTDSLSADSSPDTPAPNDMVFRWRLYHRYNKGLGQLNNDMTVTTGDQDADIAIGELPTGTAQELAKALLNNKNVTYEGSSGTDMQLAADGKPGTAGAPLSQTMLAVLTALATKHKFNISALESYGTNHHDGSAHYIGHAVDMTQMDGDPIAESGIGRTAADKKAIIDIAPLLPKGSGFGQSECGTTPPLPSGIDTFEDTCNHLHLELPASAK